VALIFSISNCAITQLWTQQNNHATLHCNATITQPCDATQQSRNLQHNNHVTLQRNNHATLQRNNHATLQRKNHATLQRNNNATLQRTVGEMTVFAPD
jgi:hypothetical protein